MARFTTTGGSGDGTPGAPGAPGSNGADGKDSLFLGTWNSVTEFLAAYQGGPVGLADGDWWAFVKDNTNPNKIYVVREDPLSATGWVIDDNEHFVLPAGADGADGADGNDGAPGAGFGIFYLGNYNPSSGYVPDIAVVRGSDGQLYLAKASGALGDPVGNTAQWEVWIPKGANGTNGTNGTNGADGADGADALWNFTGPWVNGIDYGPGSLVEFQGSTYYHPTGQYSSYSPPTNGWILVSAKGADSTPLNFWNFTGDPGVPTTGGAIVTDGLSARSAGNVTIHATTGGKVVIAGSNGEFLFDSNVPANQIATIGDIQNTGDITFDGIQIIGAGTASGDGNDLGTIELVPDGNINSDQYLIIDPTTPNHIHIRAGGDQDASNAELFLGAERTGVQVSDNSGSVTIRSKNPDQTNVYANSNSTSNTEFIHATGANIQVGDTVRLYTGGDTYVVSVVTEEYPSAGFITITAPGLSFITGEAYIFTRSTGESPWMFQTNGITFPDNTVQNTAFVGGATGTFHTPDAKIVVVTNGIITSIESLS